MAKGDFKRGKADTDDGFVPVAKLLHIGLDNISDNATRKVAGKIARGSYGNFNSKVGMQHKSVKYSLYDFEDGLSLDRETVIDCVIALRSGGVIKTDFNDAFKLNDKRFSFSINTDVNSWSLKGFDNKQVIKSLERERKEYSHKGALHKVNKITGREMGSLVDVLKENRLGFVPEYHAVMQAYLGVVENLALPWKDLKVKINHWIDVNNKYLQYVNCNIPLTFHVGLEVDVENTRTWILDRLAVQEVAKTKLPPIESWLRDKFEVNSKSQQQIYKALFLDFSWLQAIYDIPTHKILKSCIDENDISENLFGTKFKDLMLNRLVIRDAFAHLARTLSGCGKGKRASQKDREIYDNVSTVPLNFEPRYDGGTYSSTVKIEVSGGGKVIEDCPFKLALSTVKDKPEGIFELLNEFEDIHFCPRKIEFCSLELVYALTSKETERGVSVGLLAFKNNVNSISTNAVSDESGTSSVKTGVELMPDDASRSESGISLAAELGEVEQSNAGLEKSRVNSQKVKKVSGISFSKTALDTPVIDAGLQMSATNPALVSPKNGRPSAGFDEKVAKEENGISSPSAGNKNGEVRKALEAPEDPQHIKNTTYSKNRPFHARTREAGPNHLWVSFAGSASLVMSELRAVGNELMLAPPNYSFAGSGSFPTTKSATPYSRAILGGGEPVPVRVETAPVVLEGDPLDHLPDPIEMADEQPDFKTRFKPPGSPASGRKPPTPSPSTQKIEKPQNVPQNAKEGHTPILPPEVEDKILKDAEFIVKYTPVVLIPNKQDNSDEDLGLIEDESVQDGLFRTLTEAFDPIVLSEKMSRFFDVEMLSEFEKCYYAVPFYNARNENKIYTPWLAGFKAHAKCIWKIVQDFGLDDTKQFYKDLYFTNERQLMNKHHTLNTFATLLVDSLHRYKTKVDDAVVFMPEFLDVCTNFNFAAYEAEHAKTKNEEDKYSLSEILLLNDEVLMQGRFSSNLKKKKNVIDFGTLPEEITNDEQLKQFCLDVADGKYSSLMPATLRTKIFQRVNQKHITVSHLRQIAEFYPLLQKMGAYVLPPEYYPDKFPLHSNEMAVKNACMNIKAKLG